MKWQICSRSGFHHWCWEDNRAEGVKGGEEEQLEMKNDEAAGDGGLIDGVWNQIKPN